MDDVPATPSSQPQQASLTQQTILLVEDDPALALGLNDALTFEGYRVLQTDRGAVGLDLLTNEAPDCVILDLMLPDMNGYQVCSRAREAGLTTPIVMLTARGQEADKIRGLDAGADDYVTKPFSVGELLARVRAVLRRGGRAGDQPTKLRIGDVTVDVRAQTIQRDGRRIEASFYEIELLKLLYEHNGNPVSRDEILDRVWGTKASPTNRTVDNFVVRLRRKIEHSPDKPRHILTVYGFGYKMVL